MFDRMEGEGREKKERKREEKKGEYCVWIEEGKERVIYLSFTWTLVNKGNCKGECPFDL